MIEERTELSRSILNYWFSSLDDGSSLAREAEPFRTCYARWYGKEASIDAEIRQRFEPALQAVCAQGPSWDRELSAWQVEPNGLLALTILLDQFPRNMYRDTARMYESDALSLVVATQAIREYEHAALSLVQRMFLYVPLMHAENLTLQETMVARFEALSELALVRSPANAGFFRFALDYARRHRDVVRRFGRFPHRNAILGRTSTPEELEFLERDDARF